MSKYILFVEDPTGKHQFLDSAGGLESSVSRAASPVFLVDAYSADKAVEAAKAIAIEKTWFMYEVRSYVTGQVEQVARAVGAADQAALAAE